MKPRTHTVLRSWIFCSGLAAWVLAVVLALRGAWRWVVVCVVFALGADAVGRVWSRRNPIPFPYFMRWLLLVPRGPISPKRLMQLLRPRNGERILEVGPGVGVHAIPIASALLPDGSLDVLDAQQEMLDDLRRRAMRKNVTNIVATQGDAQTLPYPDHTFDAAYMIDVIGEIPDAAAALRDLWRVLKPGGRLVISEFIIDPDFIPLLALQRMAEDAGFMFERSAGPSVAYSAVFRHAVA